VVVLATSALGSVGVEVEGFAEFSLVGVDVGEDSAGAGSAFGFGVEHGFGAISSKFRSLGGVAVGNV